MSKKQEKYPVNTDNHDKVKKLISDDVRVSLSKHGINIRAEILKLFRQIDEKNYSGIKKLRNTKKPLFRKRMSDNTRLIFDFGDNWIRLWRFDRRKDVYRNMSGAFLNDPLFKIYGYDLSLPDDVDEKEIISKISRQRELQNYPGIRFYCIPGGRYLTSDSEFKTFIDREYEYYADLAEEQEVFIQGLLSSRKGVHLIQGAAGSGKTICGIEYAIRVRRGGEGVPVLFLVPTERLAVRCVEFLRKRDPDSVYFHASGSEASVIWKDISEALKSYVVVLTFRQFYELCFSAMRHKDQQERFIDSDKKIQDKIREYAEKHHNKNFSGLDPRKIYQIIMAFMKSGKAVNRKNNMVDHCAHDLALIKDCLSLETYEGLLGETNGKEGKYYDKIDMVKIIRSFFPDIFSPEIKGLNLIIDEAQDLVTEEWSLFVDIYKNCFRKDVSKLLMMGDMNQRVNITDFDWGRVKEHLFKENIAAVNQELVYNYRNTREISAFGKHIITDIYGDVYRARGMRWLPTLADPEKSAYRGPVPLMVVGNMETLVNAIENYQGSSAMPRSLSPGFYRWPIIIDDISFGKLSSLISAKMKDLNRKILLMSPENSKGDEFDTMVIINSVPARRDNIVDITRFYTSVTRSRHNLIIFFEPDVYGLFRQHGFIENNPNVDVLKNYTQQELNEIFARVGFSRFDENKFAELLREEIMLVSERTGTDRIRHLIGGIQEILSKSTSGASAEELLGELYSRVEPPAHEEIRKIIDSSNSNALRALSEKHHGNMLRSVVLWEKEGHYRGESFKVIDELKDVTGKFEIMRSAALACYTSKLEELMRNIPESDLRGVLRRVAEISSKDSDSSDLAVFLRSIMPEVRRIYSSFNEFSRSIQRGGKNG